MGCGSEPARAFSTVFVRHRVLWLHVIAQGHKLEVAQMPSLMCGRR
jgi:hypothetical protein